MASPVQVTVTTKSNAPTARQVEVHFRGRPFMRLIGQIGDDMIQQARRNVRVHGDPAGDWPKLVGFNKARSRTKKDGAKVKRASPHTGWARQKHLGKTPGRGRFGPGHLLRDTESMMRSLVVDFSVNEKVVSLTLDAKDRLNQIKLRAHSFGVPQNNLAKRDMTEDMKLFEQKALRRLQEHWSKLFRDTSAQPPKPKTT